MQSSKQIISNNIAGIFPFVLVQDDGEIVIVSGMEDKNFFRA